MIQVFALILYIGIGEERKQVEEVLYFDTVTYCNDVAEEVVKRWGHWSHKDQATAYCLPITVPDDTLVYRLK